MSKYYETIEVNGVYHKVAAIAYEDIGYARNIKAMLCSFKHKQEHDQLLSSIQKEIYIYNNRDRYITSPRAYLSNLARCKDDNAGDGWHCLICSDENNIVVVQKGEDYLVKIFSYLKNLKSGILPEWKKYFYDELVKENCIEKCKSFDLTGGYLPEVYVLKGIDTELIRNIKSKGLKTGAIALPVPINENLNTNLDFIDIIENYILPYISSEKCHYNLGDPISPIIKGPLRKGNKMTNLFRRQQIIAQGILEYFKDGNFASLFNGGTGIGKTYTSCKISLAVIEEVLHRKDGYIGVMCPAHLILNWVNGFNDCLKPIGINPKILVINNYKDIKKLSKNPIGINVLIFPKDRVKRSYLKGHNASFKHANVAEIEKYVKSLGICKNPIEFKKCNIIRGSRLRLVIARYSNQSGIPIVLYRESKDANGIKYYKFTTNCEVLLEKYGSVHKSYDFISYDLKSVKEFILNNLNLIRKQNVTLRANSNIDMNRNYIVCPFCGGKIYESSKHCLSDEKCGEFLTEKYLKNKNNKLAYCNNYVKADGSTITEYEFEQLRLKGNFKIVTDPTKEVYLDVDGNVLTGKDLELAKRNIGDFVMQVRLCGHSMFGYKESPKYGRPLDSLNYMRKLFGDKFLDVCLHDESHNFNNETNQGNSMYYAVKLSKYNILLTGTMSGGKSSDLYYTFWRVFPHKMKALGYKYEDVGLFIDHYGRRKRTGREIEGDSTSTSSGKGKLTFKSWIEIAGFSPLLYNNFLTSTMVSRKIEDMGIPLPKIVYIKEEVEMDNDQKQGYERLKSDMISFMKANPKIGLGGSYLKRLKSYPDMPNQDDIYATLKNKYNDKKKQSIFVCKPTHFDLTTRILPKEKRLISTIAKEIKQNRKVIVYTEATDKLPVAGRLYTLLKKYFNVKFLASGSCKDKNGSKIKTEEREIAIERWAREGVQVIICNPKLVETGLNLIWYPTMYFYDQVYNIFTLRQAEMRAYRPQQTKECRIYYSFYKDCIQEDAMKVIGSKKKASLALEGVFGNDMLSEMADGGDTIESILNKSLDGRITLKESDLDSFKFDVVDYDIIENELPMENDTIIDVEYNDTSDIKTTRDTIKRTGEKSTNSSSMFTFNSNFMSNFKKQMQEEKLKTGKLFKSQEILKNNGEEKEEKEIAATSEQISFF